MSVLQTLPRLAPHGAQARPTIASLLGPSPAARAIGAERLVRALREGRVSPSDVQRATQEGDAGVAALLRGLARLPARPRATPESFDLRALSQPPAPELREALARLVRRLGASGDLLPPECRALASGRLAYLGVMTTLNRAWNRRCHRLVAPLMRAVAPALAPAALPSSAFFVMPGALFEAIRRSPGSATGSRFDDADDIPEVFVEASGTMVAESPVSVQDSDDHAALCAAWDGLCAVMTFPFMSTSMEAISILVGYADELLSDAALRCEWSGDQPLIDDATLEELGEEIGFGTETPDDLDQLRSYLRFSRAETLRRRWTVASRPMRAWRKARSGTPIAAKVEALIALAKVLRRAPSIDRDRVVTDYSDEGVLPLNLMPQGTGLDSYFRYIVDQEWQQGACAHVAINCLPEATASEVDALLDRCVLEAAAASAASAVLDPAFPRAPSEPHLEIDDEED